MTTRDESVYSLCTVSDRYDRYVARMQAIGRVLNSIRRHRIAISAATVLAAVLVCGFLAIIGNFTDALVCQDFIYGDEPSYAAKAFLSDVQYQFSPMEGEAVWSETTPTIPGEYRIRAVSENGFGRPNYSEEMSITMHPMALHINIRSASFAYGDSWQNAVEHNTEVEGLVPGDRIVELEYAFAEDREGNFTASVKNIRILNSSGREVTACYALTTADGYFTMVPRLLNISIHSAAYTYGESAMDAVKENTQIQGLAPGDRIAEIEYTLIESEMGNFTASVATLHIVNATGKDVAGYYAITTTGGDFSMLPRSITIGASDAEKVYDGNEWDKAAAELISGSLADGDILNIAFSTIPADAGIYELMPVYTIVNGQDEDVTAFYQITVRCGTLTVHRRTITVIADSAEKIYDGTPLTGGWQITAGTAAPGQHIQVAVTGSQTEAGISANTATCSVFDAYGNDVSANYTITLQMGTLQVSKRPLSVITDSAEKVYDGKLLIAPGWHVTGGETARNQTLSGTVTGSQKAAGKSENTIVMSVVDVAGNDVTANYEFTIEAGTLTVIPIVLKFETDSAEKVYDGHNLEARGCRLVEGSVLANHQLIFWTSKQRLYAGSSENTLSVSILDENGNHVEKEGYEIEVNTGTLTVKTRPITFLSGSAEKLYDGKPLTCEKYTITEGTLALARGDAVRVINFTGSQTRVGSSENTFSVRILDGWGNDLTYCYDITYVYGILTVHENPNRPDTGDDSGDGGDSENDGNHSELGIGNHGLGTTIGYPDAISDTLFAQVEGISGIKTATRIYFRDASYGDYTGSGWMAPTLDTTFNVIRNSVLTYIGSSIYETDNNAAKVYLSRMDNCPVLLPYFTYSPNPINGDETDCYFEDGAYAYELQIYTGFTYANLKNMSVAHYNRAKEIQYRKFVYDQYLQIPSSTKEALLKWAAQNGISANSATLAEDIQKAILNAAVYNINGKAYPAGVDVAVYFLTEAKEGICQHFATAATLMYRAFGIPARYTVGFVDTVQNGVTTDLTGKDAHAWVEIYVDGLGWVPMEVTGSNTVLETKTELHIHAVSLTKYYDGKPFSREEMEEYIIVSGSLREGHRLEVKMVIDEHDSSPGEWMTLFSKCLVYDENGKDVTKDYYNIYLGGGTMTILPRKITITIGSASKIDDGTPLNCQDYWISEGNLAPGHVLAIEIDSILTTPGITENTASEIKIYCEDDLGMIFDATGYYEISIISGYLEITQSES